MGIGKTENKERFMCTGVRQEPLCYRNWNIFPCVSSQYRATELGLGTLGLGLTTGGAAAAVVRISRPQQPHNTSPARTVRWCCSCCSSMCWVHSTLMPLQIWNIFYSANIQRNILIPVEIWICFECKILKIFFFRAKCKSFYSWFVLTSCWSALTTSGAAAARQWRTGGRSSANVSKHKVACYLLQPSAEWNGNAVTAVSQVFSCAKCYSGLLTAPFLTAPLLSFSANIHFVIYSIIYFNL